MPPGPGSGPTGVKGAAELSSYGATTGLQELYQTKVEMVQIPTVSLEDIYQNELLREVSIFMRPKISSSRKALTMLIEK